MDVKLKAVEVKAKFPVAYRKIAIWYAQQHHKQPLDDEVAEAMFTVIFSDLDVEMLRQFLKDAGISFRTCGGPSFGYSYHFQGDEPPVEFPYYGEEGALYAGLYVSLSQINKQY